MTCTNTGCQLELRDTSHLLEKKQKTPTSGARFCRFMTSALKTDSFVLDWYLLPFTSCILIFLSVCVLFLLVWYGSISDTGGVVISIVWFWHCAIWPLSKVTHFFAIATHYIGHKSGGTLIQQLLQPRSFWIFFRYLPLPCGLQLFRPLSLPIIQWPGLLYWNAPQPDQYVSIAQWSAPPPHVCHAHYVLGQPRQGWHCKVLGVFVLSYSFVFCPSVCLGLSPQCYTAPALGKVWQNMRVGVETAPGAQHRSLLAEQFINAIIISICYWLSSSS